MKRKIYKSDSYFSKISLSTKGFRSFVCNLLMTICISSMMSTFYIVTFLSLSSGLALAPTGVSASAASAVVASLLASPSTLQSDWRITFYTGDKIWAGTDSDIYIQLHGNLGNSRIIQLNPSKNQMETQSIDTFNLGNLDSKQIGDLRSITVGKQHSYAFFNDWQLVKVELTDPRGKKYLFECNCWLTTLKYKRTIELKSIDGVESENGSVSDLFSIASTKTSRVFPMTIGLLFLLLILIIFTYFGNVLWKKWNENSNYFFNSRRNRYPNNQTRNSSAHNNRRARHTSRNHHLNLSVNRANTNNINSSNNNNNNNTNSDLYKDDDDEEFSNRERVYNFTNDLTNVTTNPNRSSHLIGGGSSSTTSYINSNEQQPFSYYARNSSGINEDKPPDYRELFPLKTIDSSTHSHQTQTSAPVPPVPTAAAAVASSTAVNTISAIDPTNSNRMTTVINATTNTNTNINESTNFTSV